jgi:hypothetical protein
MPKRAPTSDGRACTGRAPRARPAPAGVAQAQCRHPGATRDPICRRATPCRESQALEPSGADENASPAAPANRRAAHGRPCLLREPRATVEPRSASGRASRATGVSLSRSPAPRPRRPPPGGARARRSGSLLELRQLRLPGPRRAPGAGDRDSERPPGRSARRAPRTDRQPPRASRNVCSVSRSRCRRTSEGKRWSFSSYARGRSAGSTQWAASRAGCEPREPLVNRERPERLRAATNVSVDRLVVGFCRTCR